MGRLEQGSPPKAGFPASIANVRRVCLGNVAAIRRASFYLAMQVTKILYLSFVIPHLVYCSTVWHNCGAVRTGRVKHIQNYALRAILKKPYRSDTREMCKQAGPSQPRTQKAQLQSTDVCTVVPLSIFPMICLEKGMHPYLSWDNDAQSDV